MRLTLIPILIAAALTIGCEPQAEWRHIDDNYAQDADPIGPQAYQDDYPAVNAGGPSDISGAPTYRPPLANDGQSVADSLGITSAEQRRREMQAAEQGTLGSATGQAQAPRDIVYRPPVRTGSMTEYVVVRGDSLWKISRRLLGKGSRWKEIAAANPGIDPAKIMPGQVLLIPAN